MGVVHHDERADIALGEQLQGLSDGLVRMDGGHATTLTG
jgi:hypothetical protein